MWTEGTRVLTHPQSSKVTPKSSLLQCFIVWRRIATPRLPVLAVDRPKAPKHREEMGCPTGKNYDHFHKKTSTKMPQKCHLNISQKTNLETSNISEKKQRVFPKFQAFQDLLDLFGFRFRAIEIWVEPAPGQLHGEVRIGIIWPVFVPKLRLFNYD